MISIQLIIELITDDDNNQIQSLVYYEFKIY
jgi:hypothetical protein